MFLDNNEMVVNGKFVKILKYREEWDVNVHDPELILKKIKDNAIKADIFSFVQRLPESKPKFNYYMEWESWAAMPILSYEYWLKKQISKNSRKKIGLAKRKGVEVRICDFNDDYINGQLEIYHETPVRQLTPNTAYTYTFEKAKSENETFLDRAIFLGAFYADEMIGFLKIVGSREFARTMGIIGKVAHRDKAPMNLLVAKAIEICAEKNIPYLTYGNFDYGKLGSTTLKQFKKNLGFENIITPRYYIPLTIWGKYMLKCKLHNRFVQLLPFRLVRYLLFLRGKWYEKKYAKYLK